MCVMCVMCGAGKKEGIGVENLRASGMIAGETSQAYEEVFTISLVTTLHCYHGNHTIILVR